jgi:hypothetical protein
LHGVYCQKPECVDTQLIDGGMAKSLVLHSYFRVVFQSVLLIRVLGATWAMDREADGYEK